jgi:hypothetical protein
MHHSQRGSAPVAVQEDGEGARKQRRQRHQCPAGTVRQALHRLLVPQQAQQPAGQVLQRHVAACGCQEAAPQLRGVEGFERVGFQARDVWQREVAQVLGQACGPHQVVQGDLWGLVCRQGGRRCRGGVRGRWVERWSCDIQPQGAGSCIWGPCAGQGGAAGGWAGAAGWGWLVGVVWKDGRQVDAVARGMHWTFQMLSFKTPRVLQVLVPAAAGSCCCCC